MIVSIFWFIEGEIEFKSSMFKLKDYAFMIIIMFFYLVTGLEIDNAIIGCIIYVVLALINIRIFLFIDINFKLQL